MSSDEQAVRAVVERMTQAFEEGDIATVMASYEDKATVVFEPGAPVSDPARLRQMFVNMAAIKPRFAYDGHDVFVEGDIAVHFAPWCMTGTAPDGSEVTQSGLSVAVMRRQADGSWRMVIDNPHGQRLMEQ